MTTGIITLYFDGEVIAVRNFRSKTERMKIMNALNDTYQVMRQKKIVYYQITKE